MKPSSVPPGRLPHVLFLNTQDSLRADVSVHVSLARALDRTQVRVTVATSRYESPGDSAREAFAAIPGLELLALDLGRPVSRQHGGRKALALLHNALAAATLVSLASWCRREHVDVIHVTERPRDAMFGLLLARLAGCACLIHAHTSYYPQRPSVRVGVEDWILRQADAVVGVSEFTASTFRRLAGVASKRVFAVHNAVDDSVLHSSVPPDARASMRSRLGIPPDALVVGSVGRLMQGKDQASLVEAFASVRNATPGARLIIAGVSADTSPDGRGDYRDYLLRRVDELGLSDAVIFTGFLPHAEMPWLYAAFDLFVHPCVEEPFGLVVVEAMGRSLPVIAVNAGGVPEIIRDGVDGVLVPRSQPSALAEAMATLVSDPARRAHLVEAGRARVLAAFTAEVQARAMLMVYRQVVAGRARKPLVALRAV